MRLRTSTSCAVACCAVIGLLACKADIPDGVYACDKSADCPSGYSCRAKAGAEQEYCYASDESESGGPDGGSQGGRDGSGTGGGGGRSGAGGDSGDGGAGSGAGRGGAAGDGGSGGSSMPEPVAPTRGSFSSAGERRGEGGFVLYDDGFEHGDRLCTTDRALCVTGGFSP